MHHYLSLSPVKCFVNVVSLCYELCEMQICLFVNIYVISLVAYKNIQVQKDYIRRNYISIEYDISIDNSV